MITLDILEQRLLPSPYFDACLVCLFSIIINPIFICPIKTLRVSIQIINRFGEFSIFLKNVRGRALAERARGHDRH